ncbi:MAG: putative DNA binding domain-containing protein [Candidatus Komeilibacteria bacterium]|nr:putative DNA binding domain-containing protein [Candidatus Komeilibacteria bacterium]
MYIPEDIDDILQNRENKVLEFKEAKSNFDSRERSDYCAAIANAGGGKLLLGVNNDGKIIGTAVYAGTIEKIPQEIYQVIGIWVTVEDINHQNGRVVIFDIPARPVGHCVKSNGRYLTRKGESLVEMDSETMRQILNEIQPDFSASIIENLIISDLDEQAVGDFKKRMAEKTGNPALINCSTDKILQDAELIRNEKLTLACLILLGKKEKIAELLPQAEIIYEWRSTPEQIHHDFRITWRAPYFVVYDDIWQTIHARNLRTPYQEGFIQQEILAFDEKSCREAVNNAVAHRDYSISGRSIFIYASPQSFAVVSPGGFPQYITPENILKAAPHWRNRLIAEAFERTKLVEKSGQGIDVIFEAAIRQGKGIPDFKGTDAHTVRINIPAKVKDAEFVKFLEKVMNEKQVSFSFDEIYELELLREQKITTNPQHKEKFLKLGIVEKIGKTSGTKYMLSHRYYSYEEKPGIYTRIKGISREKNKELILNHIQREGRGIKKDFIDTFPELKVSDISNLLQELKEEGKIERIGTERAGFWKLKSDEKVID